MCQLSKFSFELIELDPIHAVRLNIVGNHYILLLFGVANNKNLGTTSYRLIDDHLMML